MPAMRVEEHFTMTALYSADLFILEIGLRGKKFIRINLREICRLRYKLEANGKPLEIAYAGTHVGRYPRTGRRTGRKRNAFGGGVKCVILILINCVVLQPIMLNWRHEPNMCVRGCTSECAVPKMGLELLLRPL